MKTRIITLCFFCILSLLAACQPANSVSIEKAGAEVTVIEFSDGRYGFDSRQETEDAAVIIGQTIEFMREKFGPE